MTYGNNRIEGDPKPTYEDKEQFMASCNVWMTLLRLEQYVCVKHGIFLQLLRFAVTDQFAVSLSRGYFQGFVQEV